MIAKTFSQKLLTFGSKSLTERFTWDSEKVDMIIRTMYNKFIFAKTGSSSVNDIIGAVTNIYTTDEGVWIDVIILDTPLGRFYMNSDLTPKVTFTFTYEEGSHEVIFMQFEAI